MCYSMVHSREGILDFVNVPERHGQQTSKITRGFIVVGFHGVLYVQYAVEARYRMLSHSDFDFTHTVAEHHSDHSIFLAGVKPVVLKSIREKIHLQIEIF